VILTPGEYDRAIETIIQELKRWSYTSRERHEVTRRQSARRIA
jgi:hypothetical protein